MNDEKRAKAERMKHPDWHKYSGWPPSEPVETVEAPARTEGRRKSAKAVEADE